MHFFCSGVNAECFFLLFLWGIDGVLRRHVWKEVDMSSDR